MDFEFEKFMKDICKREESAKERAHDLHETGKELPQSKYNKLYREKWQNRIRFRRKNGSN